MAYGRTTSHNRTARDNKTGLIVKSVFDNSMLAHVWAQQTQTFGRSNNGNLYFEGRALYSYGSHYMVALILDSGVCLINEAKYSVTTSGHRSDARRAIRHLESHGVPDLTSLARLLDSPAAIVRHIRENVAEYQHESAVAVMVAAGYKPEAKLNETLEKFRRESIKAKAASGAADLADETKRNLKWAKAYAEQSDSDFAKTVAAAMRNTYIPHGYGDKPVKPSGSGVRFKSELLAYQKAAKARGWIRVARILAKRRKAFRAALDLFARKSLAKSRNAYTRGAITNFRRVTALLAAGTPLRDSYQYREFASTCQQLNRHALPVATRRIIDGYGLAASAESIRLQPIEEAKLREDRARAAAQKFAKESENRAAWLAGEHVPSWRGSDESGGALLRAIKVEIDATGAICGGLLQTSHGAEVPLVHALRAFAFLKLCHETGRTWKANGRTIRVGHFTISEVRPDGFRAGCHDIYWPECERLARALDVAGIAPSESALSASRELAAV